MSEERQIVLACQESERFTARGLVRAPKCRCCSGLIWRLRRGRVAVVGASRFREKHLAAPAGRSGLGECRTDSADGP